MSGIKKVLLSGAALLLVGWSSAQAAQPPAADPPSVSRLSPASSPVGATVVIGGSNFGVRQGSSTVTLVGGTASFSISTLSALSSHSITAVYGGDGNFVGSTSGAVAQTVESRTAA